MNTHFPTRWASKSRVLITQAAALFAAGFLASAVSSQEVTTDGLHPVEDAGLQQVWADPDADLSGYRRILLVQAQVAFRKNGQRDININTPYRITNQEMEAIREEMSALFGEIFREKLYAGGYQEFLEEDGSTFIFYVPKVFGKSLGYFEDKIRDSFQDIADGNFSNEYFESIKYGIYRNYNLSMEQLASRGRFLGLSFIYDIDHADFLSFSDKVRNLTKEEVQSVAARYYGKDYFTLQSRTGFPKKAKLNKPPYKPISGRTEAASNYARKFNALPEKPPAPNFIDLENDFSVTDGYIYHTENPLNDIFTLRLSIAGGITKDSRFTLLAAALNSTGTTSYSASEIKNKFANIGASYSFSADYNSFDMSLTGIDEKFDETLELLVLLLKDFAPTVQTINYLYNQRTANNKISRNNPSSGGSILYSYGLFGNQSSYKTRIPIKQLKNLDPSVLSTKLKELLANGISSIHYVGQRSEQEIAEKLKGVPLYRKNTVDRYTFLEAQDPSETTFYIVNDKKAIQSYVYYIINGEPLDYNDDYKKEAFDSYYTNSLSGLLFQEVREFRSLAYATGGNYIDPIYEPNKRGRLVLFTGSQADKTTDAVNVVMGLIKNMPTYEARLPAIREGLTLTSGSAKPGFRDLSITAETFLKTGYEADPNEMNFRQYPNLEFSDILMFYENNIRDKPVTVTIYGDASQFDLTKLQAWGKVIELNIDDILVE